MALVAILTTLSLMFLYLSSFLPMGRMGVVAVAGLIPAVAVVSSGLHAGFLCFTSTAILGFLLIPDKSVAVLFSLFFGLYPMVKSLFERLHKPAVRWLLKLLFFNLVLIVFWVILRELFLPFLPSKLRNVWLVFVMGNIVFIIYDIGFSKLVQFYTQRVERAIRK